MMKNQNDVVFEILVFYFLSVLFWVGIVVMGYLYYTMPYPV